MSVVKKSIALRNQAFTVRHNYVAWLLVD